MEIIRTLLSLAGKFTLTAILVSGPAQVLLLAGCGKAKEEAGSSTSANAPSTTGSQAATASNSDQPAVASGGDSGVAEVTESSLKEPVAANSSTADPVAKQGTTTPSPKTPNQPAPTKAAPRPKATAEQIAKWALPILEPFELLNCHEEATASAIAAMAVLPDGKKVFTAGTLLSVWPTGADRPEKNLLQGLTEEQVKLPLRCLAISPDGKLLVAGDSKGSLLIWKTDDLTTPEFVNAHSGYVSKIVFSPNSERLASTSYDGQVKIWATNAWKATKSLSTGNLQLEQMEFVNDQLLATASEEVALWNVETGSKETTLTNGRVRNAVLGVTPSRKLMIYADAEDKLQVWNVEKKTSEPLGIPASGVSRMSFSKDEKWLASVVSRTLYVWDFAARRLVQAIDSEGSAISDIAWHPAQRALVTASGSGRLRIWGLQKDAAALGIASVLKAPAPVIDAKLKKPYSPAALEAIMDLRSLPAPSGIQGMGESGMLSYSTQMPEQELKLFYRHVLEQAGWTEMEPDPASGGAMVFEKNGCRLSVSSYPMQAIPGVSEAGLQVSLHLQGNYDVRWLPHPEKFDSSSGFASFFTEIYSVKGDLVDIEVDLLKKIRGAGWVPYSRLDAASLEEVDARRMSFIQGALDLSVSIQRRPNDPPGTYMVQTNVSTQPKTLPIPDDCGFVEFEGTTEMKLVANTKKGIAETVKFYDTEMASQGWLQRDVFRRIEEEKAFLTYIRGQREVMVRLVKGPTAGTRIIVGDAERTSWQFAKAEPESGAGTSTKTEKATIEAADIPMVPGATEVKYDIDEKTISFQIANLTAPALADKFGELLAPLGWIREPDGSASEEYTLATYKKGKSEVQLRARKAADKGTSAQISGDEVSWKKPLPAKPVRVSFATWLRRNKFEASLDKIDDFLSEMKKIN